MSVAESPKGISIGFTVAGAGALARSSEAKKALAVASVSAGGPLGDNITHPGDHPSVVVRYNVHADRLGEALEVLSGLGVTDVFGSPAPGRREEFAARPA